MDTYEYKLKESKQWFILIFATIVTLIITGVIAMVIDYQKYESPHQKRMNLIEEKTAIYALKQRMNIDSLYNEIHNWNDSVLTEISKEEIKLQNQK